MSVAWTSGDLMSTPHDTSFFYSALLGGRLVPRTLTADEFCGDPRRR